MIKRLVSLGSVIVDLVLEVPRLPDRGGDVLASQRGMAAGGAFNVLSAAARLGLPGIYAGPHGTGPFGDLVRAALAREGVPTTMPPNPDLDTGWTLALVEPDGERTFVTVTGADALVTPAALRPTEYRGGDAVYVSGYDLDHPGRRVKASVSAVGQREGGGYQRRRRRPCRRQPGRVGARTGLGERRPPRQPRGSLCRVPTRAGRGPDRRPTPGVRRLALVVAFSRAQQSVVRRGSNGD